MPHIAYFDCFSGVSGNMILGALLDAGLALEDLQAELAKLPISGFQIKTERVSRQGISAVHVTVETEETHARRHLHHIVEILEQSSLDQAVKDDCRAIFTRLAEAEAKVHNTTVEHIHFHEVGALDAMVDIVGAVAGLRRLGVDTIYVSPFSFGTGFTVCAHGKIPVPVPATVELLKNKPVHYTDIEAELVTPTGAAILSTLVAQFGLSPMTVFRTIGYGAGTRELPIPNTLRLFLGQSDGMTSGYEYDVVAVLETNIDDMNPEFYEYLFEKLLQAGALDVYTMPAAMKKNRPGTILTVIAPLELRHDLFDILLTETTSLGVRWQTLQRAKARRETHAVDTQYGSVRLKVGRLNNRILNIAPEYDDCVQLAEAHPGTALKQIYQEAIEKGRRLLAG